MVNLFIQVGYLTHTTLVAHYDNDTMKLVHKTKKSDLDSLLLNDKIPR